MRVSLILLLLGATAFVACRRDDSNPVVPEQPSSTSYFPTMPGTKWEYYDYQLDSLGNIDRTTRVVAVDSVMSTFTYLGRPAFAMHHMRSDTLPSVDTESIGTDGTYAIIIDTGKAGPQWAIVQHLGNTSPTHYDTTKIPINQTFTYQGIPIPVNTTITVIESYAGEQAVTVPAGTFTGRQYRDTSMGAYSVFIAQASLAGSVYTTYVPNVGLAQQRNFQKISVSITGQSMKQNFGTYRELVWFKLGIG